MDIIVKRNLEWCLRDGLVKKIREGMSLEELVEIYHSLQKRYTSEYNTEEQEKEEQEKENKDKNVKLHTEAENIREENKEMEKELRMIKRKMNEIIKLVNEMIENVDEENKFIKCCRI